ncbi:MAG: recombinase family protein [Ruminococcaceae bacterium]|nr:recombinase family protein [Oscillospiraceae bacterium]
MTAVIYARYSSDSQREESIDGQLRECMAFAERQGISVIDTYIDRALSAKTDNRPQFQKMIELETTKEELELKIIKEELKRPPLTKEGLILWLQRFRSLDTTKKEHKQRLIDSFVNAVYVYDDKLVLIFNYNEANTTVTLDEVNGSIIECSGTPKIRTSLWVVRIFRFTL